MRKPPEPISFMNNVAQSEALLICFSHLRWNFVFQRPQHLMTRFAKHYSVLFWEEPIFDASLETARLDINAIDDKISVATPHLPENMRGDLNNVLKRMLSEHLAANKKPIIRWYYTPMMLPFSEHIENVCTIYDCMDELANFDFAPKELTDLEQKLMSYADLVFTGGYSLYEVKRNLHNAVYPFPSSVDKAHFETAKTQTSDPADQASLRHPRLGFYGVIDERLDLDLLSAVADARPDWTLVMIGPVVKVDPARLPQRPNIAYLGMKNYAELPQYVAGWDVALMPFAINDATRFISPTKTPEYLAAGLPVVSTPITDVIRHYGDLEAVAIAKDAQSFVAACEQAFALAADRNGAWRSRVTSKLSDLSWESVVYNMVEKITAVTSEKSLFSAPYEAASSRPHYDYLVVGAGFAGSVMAERLAADAGKKVLVIDRRPHVAGNAFDHYDEAGILVHKYGPHIFHTNSEDIFEYLSRFTEWHPYEHRVLANVDGKIVPMPINRTTINMLYGLSLSTDAEAEAFFASRAEPVTPVKTSADVVISVVGRELYETFFQGYTRKQWGMDPSELHKSVTARVPIRTNTDDRYFGDSFQAMPKAGYTAMFERMLDHPNIDIRLGVDFAEIRDDITYDNLVYTGPIDEYFGHCYGRLPYRSLRFQHESLDQEWHQPVAVMNYPREDVPYTRITEYKHMTGQVADKTSITYEYPSAEGDPYYPIPRAENQALFKRYEALADRETNVLFVGRLATYRYYNMDQVVGQALATYKRHMQSLQSDTTVATTADAALTA